ncbi:hypothetical protein LTR37_014131 [Vermiconidia calcicola]|uniref:Uncharacterized protein n=1 Tax=Vermiconidia calcicola TaxID=1690605 RepID=A0ACC3MUA8_9PEZI|nr:hypothetical protein LTR37_014131 [Vermiconidia calcicola]
MNALKNAVGVGKKDKEGDEPVSGEQGEGTTAAPFDGGNREAQENAGTSTESKSGPIETTGAEQQASTSNPDPVSEQAKLPPNHLGYNVPSGASLDFAPPQLPESAGNTQDPHSSKDMASSEQQNQSVASASAEGVDAGPSYPRSPSSPSSSRLSPTDAERSPSSGGAGSLAATQKLRGSRASVALPTGQRVHNPHATNPGRIPTAGGKAVGHGIGEERRQSRISEADMPRLDKQGSPDPVTQGNTQTNVAPQSTGPVEPSDTRDDRATPMFNSPTWKGEGEGAQYATAGAERNESSATGTSTSQSTTDKMKEKVKENAPTGSSPSGGRERRSSRMEAFKGKFGFGKKS